MVFCTTYVLILPAVTLEGKTYCDKEEHTHTDECYAIVSSNETDMLADPSDQDDESETSAFSSDDQDTENTSHRKLICGKEAHEHTPQCYSNPNLKESRAHWNDSLPDVAEANNSLNELIYLTAHSQLGYNPANEDTHLNYQVQEDGHTKYYWNRYAAFADANHPYVQDNSVFVNFVLKHSDNTLPWKQDVNEWQSLEYIDPYADNNIDASLWQSSWQHISLDQAKRGAIVLFRNEDQSTADSQSSSSFESQPASTENADGFAETANSTDFNSSQNSKDPDESSTDESSAVKLEAGILAEDLPSENEAATQSSTPESTDPAIEEGFAFDSDFGTDSTSSNSAATESQPIEEVQIISTWKDQKPESRKIPAENIIGVYQVKNDVIDPTHITDDDADEEKNEDQDKDKDQNPAAPDQNQNQIPTTPSDGIGTTTETPGSDPTDPDGSNNGQTSESPTTPGQSTTPTDQNPSNPTDGSNTTDKDNKNNDSSGIGNGSNEAANETNGLGEIGVANKVQSNLLTKPSTGLSNQGSSAQQNQVTSNISVPANVLLNLQQEEAIENYEADINAASEETETIKIKYDINLPDKDALPDAHYDYIFDKYELPMAPVPSDSLDNEIFDVPQADSYTLLVPNTREYRAIYQDPIRYESNLPRKDRSIVYYLKGWKIGNTLYEPGETIPWTELVAAKPSSTNDPIIIKGEWSTNNNNYFATAVFSVNFSAAITTDYTSNAPVDNNNWVDGVYSTAVICDNYPANGINPSNFEPSKYGSYQKSASFIAHQAEPNINYQDSNGSNGSQKTYITDLETRTLIGTDTKIRTLVDAGVNGSFIKTGISTQDYGFLNYGGSTEEQYTFRLASFPEDDKVIAILRNYLDKNSGSIKDVNGNTIDEDDLTPENYQICWFVFKLNWDGFFHIDGKLVPKESHINITKSFFGDKSAIETIKNKDGNKFNITLVKKDKNNNEIVQKTLYLPDSDHLTTDFKSLSVDKNENVYGKQISENTYSWTIPTYILDKYIIKENNYLYNSNNIVTIPQYSITNPPSNEEANNSNRSLQQYKNQNGVEINTVSYSKYADPSTYQTVNFYNSYYETSSLVLQKIDVKTANGTLGGATFTVRKKDDEELTLYSLIKDNELHIYPGAVEGAEHLPDNQFTTVTNQRIILEKFKDESAGNYNLTEEYSPNGYEKIPSIEIAFKSDGKLDSVKQVDEYGNIVNNSTCFKLETINGVNFLQINNTPQTINVSINKNWKLDTEKQDVVVALYRNGSEVGERITLNNDNNWHAEWTDQPVAVDGQPATYEVREMRIGNQVRDEKSDLNQDPDFDGFLNYEVTYSPKNQIVDLNNPQNIELNITNKKDTGQVTLEKINADHELLEGATFEAYKLNDDGSILSNTKRIVSSDKNGEIEILELEVGEYLFREIQAPTGYKLSNDEYRLEVKYIRNGIRQYSLSKVIYNSEDGSTILEPIPSKTIENIRQTANLAVKKVKQNGEALAGIEFKLFKYSSDKFLDTDAVLIYNGDNEVFISDSNGDITLPELEIGFYKLQEVKTQDGYYLPNEDFKFEIKADPSTDQALLNWKNKPNSDENSPYYEVNSRNNVTITNLTGQKLPDTGGPGIKFYTSGGILLLAASCLLYMFSKKQSYGKGEQ